MQSQRKKPTFAIPSTMIIMPAIKMIVCQLIPEEASLDSPAAYQNPVVKKLCKFRVRMIAPMLCIPSPKTRSRVRRPHASVIHCLSQISRMISRNMARKMMIANTCANICVLLFSHNRYPHQKLCRYHLSFVSNAKSQSPVLLPILTVNIGNHEISLSGTVLMYASYISFKKAEAAAPDR